MADILSQEEIDKLLSTVIDEEEAGLAQFGKLSTIVLNTINQAFNADIIEQNSAKREYLLIDFMEHSEKGIIIATTAKHTPAGILAVEEEEELEIGLIFKTQDCALSNLNDLLLDMAKRYFIALGPVIITKMDKFFSFKIDEMEAKELHYHVDEGEHVFHADEYIY